MTNFARTVFIALILAALSACNTYGKDNTPKPTPLAPLKSEISPTLLWSQGAGRGADKNYLKFSPAFDNNRIFTVDYRGNIYALDATSGKRLWTAKTPAPITTGPGAGEHIIVIASDTAKAFAYDQATGKQLWVASLPTESLAEPTIHNHSVFIKTIDGKLTALDAKNGHVLWYYQQDTPSLILQAASRVVVDNDKAVVGFANGKITVLTTREGNLLYEKIIAVPQGNNVITAMVDIDATPIIQDNVVYVATYQGNVAALSVNSGDTLWQHPISTFTGIAADDKQLYVSEADSTLLAFDNSTGNIKWKQDKLLQRNITGPAIIDNTIVVGDMEGYLHWISPVDGHLIGRNKVAASAILATPVVVNNIVYVTTSNGLVAAFTLKELKK